MSKKKLAALLLVATIVVGGGSAYVLRGQLRAVIDTISGADFQGSGSGQVEFVIKSGDTGETVASNLVKMGVTKNFSFTYKRIIARNSQFVPGTFKLQKGMAADKALDLLGDPSSKLVTRVTVKEGLRINNVLSVLSKASSIPLNEFENAVKDPTVYGLPGNIPNMDGYLFPATYEIEPGAQATDIIRQMVDRMSSELNKFGVKDADRHRVLTMASIIQKEARQTPDFYKVSRVFYNRIDKGMHLQSDATVSYGSGGTTVTTTDSERADGNGYNTYVHAGLPIGPIGAPGSTAIDAALHPAEGTWLYFCAVNLKTGETVFSTTYADHGKAVKQWQQWMRDNPGWNG
ncbi:MAG: endolytic transglycosylase MltG [Micrococcales bacterium]